MAIVQISRITNRKGLTENLPQLAGAELGYCLDSRRLFIGNGTLAEGAPVIGNTEILTEFSDITVLSDYTYEDVAVGYAAQTGPTPSDPVVRTVQAKLDDFADVRDFGAVGDGSADDTEAINRALFQLYCRENNSQVRRTLYFPAGTYKVTETILIPSYAKLVGEGADCTFIFLDTTSDISSLNEYVARFADSLQQIGANIGNNGATPPRNIEISSMTFQTQEITDVFLVQNATQCFFDSVNFIGPLTVSEIVDATDDIAGVRFASTSALVCNMITFDKCRFSNLTYGINTNTATQSITVSNGKFSVLYQGVVLDDDATGFRVVHNMFDDVFDEGIVYDDVSFNVSAYNAFYDVGYNLGTISGTPITAMIRFGNDNNISVGDMFARTNSQALVRPRVSIDGTNQTSTSNATATQMQLGRYVRQSGTTLTLQDAVTNQSVISLNSLDIRAFALDYTITRDVSIRTGRLTVAAQASDDSSLTLSYADDYNQNLDTGITLAVVQSGDTVTVRYTSSSTGNTGTMTFSVAHLA
jgi:hypothetical protein